MQGLFTITARADGHGQNAGVIVNQLNNGFNQFYWLIISLYQCFFFSNQNLRGDSSLEVLNDLSANFKDGASGEMKKIIFGDCDAIFGADGFPSLVMDGNGVEQCSVHIENQCFDMRFNFRCLHREFKFLQLIHLYLIYQSHSVQKGGFVG